MLSLESLQTQINEIKSRNARVEADKAWETSWTRRVTIVVLTYIVVLVIFVIARLPDPFVNAIVPSLAFVVSSLTMGGIKRWWLGNVRK